MKYLSVILFFACLPLMAQMNIEDARNASRKYKIGSYSYHESFIGHSGYGAPVILTSDGGSAFYGDTGDSTGSFGLLVKLDRTGKEEWTQKVRPQFDEMESQSVAEDLKGNYFVFMLSYDSKRYRGGSQRIVSYDKSGKLIWDKTIGEYTLVNNPVISYIRSQKDGGIYLRGHIAPKQPAEGKDPEYHFWEGWMNAAGILKQKTGDIINWSDQKWQLYYKPGQEK